MKRIHFVKLLLVTVLACGNHFAWSADETITITYSDITQTSYNSSEVTFTDGVSFGYVNMMQNNANGTPTGWAKSQVIQCRASSTIRNTNAITGLKKIRVYLAVNTNTFTIYTSSSAITSKPNDGGTSRPTTATGTKEQTYTTYSNKQTGTGTTTLNYYDFDVASGQDYFFLSVGSSAVYIWSIELTYSSSSSGETTNYCDVSFVDNVQGTDCSSFDMTDVAENTQIVFNSISDKPQATTGTCEQTHYHFVGWIEDGETPNETGSNVIAAGTTSIKATKDVTYKAVWAQEAN